MLELRIVTPRGDVPIHQAPRNAVHELIDQLIASLDERDVADTDLEPEEDCCIARDDDPGGIHGDYGSAQDGSDDEPTAWVERINQAREPRGFHGTTTAAILEDDEDDDRDTSVEDHPAGFDPEEDYGIEDMPQDEVGDGY